MKKYLLSSVLLASLIISQSIFAGPKDQAKGGACISNNFMGRDGERAFNCVSFQIARPTPHSIVL